MKILLIRLRLIGDVVFTTPIPRALKRTFPDARISYLVEDAAAPVLAHNPHIDDLIIVQRPRGWRRLVADMKLAARVRRRALRRRPRPSRRPAQQLADARQRRTAADRLRRPGPELDVYADGQPSARTARAAFGGQSVGPAGSDRRMGRRGSRIRLGMRSRCRGSGARSGPSRRAWPGAASRARTS